jgi:hypothetical protein
VPSHHLDDHHPHVTLRRGVQSVDRIGRDLHGRVEPEPRCLRCRCRSSSAHRRSEDHVGCGDRRLHSATRCRRSRSDRRGPCRTSSPRRSRHRRARRTGFRAGRRARCLPWAATRASTRPSAAWYVAPSRRPMRRGTRRSRRRRPAHLSGRWHGRPRRGPGSHLPRSGLPRARRSSRRALRRAATADTASHDRFGRHRQRC